MMTITEQVATMNKAISKLKYVVVAVSPNPDKPASYFSRWGDDMSVSRCVWSCNIADARRFGSQDEARTEATLLAPSYSSRLVQLLMVGA